MNNDKTSGLKEGNMPLWKYFLYAMIGCFSACALIGIYLILVGSYMKSDSMMTLLRLCASAAVLGLFSLFTMNNLFRRESKKDIIKITSTIALVLNLVWMLPWLLIVWDAFDVLKDKCGPYPYDSYYYSSNSFRNFREIEREYESCMEPYDTAIEVSWKIIADGIILAVILTMMAEFLGYEDYNDAIKVMKYTTMALSVVVGGYLLIQINFTDISPDESFLKALAIMVIILVFCVVVTPILVRVQRKKHGFSKKASETNKVVEAKPTDEEALRAKIRAEVEAELREQIRKEVLAEIKAQNKE